ncbi:amidohydrolase family protein [Streptosporangium sp. V21-05]|uniref:amidohydrolase family protein n=1 Tax=Streptosporangium sp. V21-05 TaxID=3446115 RepID=UPI003F53141B
MTVDVHQHLWTPAFVDALRRRTTAPRLDGWTLHLDGEPAYEVDPADHDLAGRLALNAGLDLALVSLSSPLGIESLPPGEAWPIIDAYHEDALALPAPFGAWAATCLSEIDPARLAKALDARDGVRNDVRPGLAGLQLPATAVRDAAGLTRVAPLLDVLTERDLPLFVHPGPATEPEGPGWWPAVVPYVQQMHAAWYAFAAFGRARHPRLRVCFSLLAGLAPLHSERLASRGGEGRGQVDPDMFLETSSYGPRAIDAVVRELGVDIVVSGSDQPYATAPDPALGDAAWHAVAVTNPNRLLNGKESRK